MNTISDSGLMDNNETTNQRHPSEADINVISRKTIKSGCGSNCKLGGKTFIPQIICGINESLYTKIASLEHENKALKIRLLSYKFKQIGRNNIAAVTVFGLVGSLKLKRGIWTT
ncbi:hypothetical protein DPMN_000740 [Dreissena polymorpha]|uniref:Uncharacterized protein n=1 Tax=Dreissena polymorpha TaxID=45954 RepID=A0A9D4MIU3_DREPO|nr:hypothetical protein DPMN_000740 [Dreissena polymorpha]